MPSNAEKAAKGQADLRRLIELGELQPGPGGLLAHLLQGDRAFSVPFGLQTNGKLTYDGTAYDAPSAALKAALQAHVAVPAGYTGNAENPNHNGWLWIVRSNDDVKLDKLRELMKEQEEQDWEEDEEDGEEDAEEPGPPALADAGGGAARREKVRRRDSGARSEGQDAGADIAAEEAPEPAPKRRPGKEPVGEAPAAKAYAALQVELQAPARTILAAFERDCTRLEDLQQRHSDLQRECQGMEAELRQAGVSQADVAAAQQALRTATATLNQLQAEAQAAAEECQRLLASSPVGATAGSRTDQVAQLQQMAQQKRTERKQAALERDAAVQERQQLQAEQGRLQGQLARFAELAQQVLPFVKELQALQQEVQQQAGAAEPAHGQ